MRTLKVNEKFQELIPPLMVEEYNQLEKNMVEEGCRDPLVVWNDYIVDGHNRYEICRQHGIEFNTVEKYFDDEEAAMDWIDANQLGRRNLTPDQMRLIRGRRYNRLKKPMHDGGKGVSRSGDQNEPYLRTADKIAGEHGVSAPTIKRDAQLQSQLEELKTVYPEEVERVYQGKAKIKTVFDAKRADEKAEKPWTELELERKQKVENGETVTANIYKDIKLIEWAKENNLYKRIDRATEWGNPFEIPDDGEREEVCKAYVVYFSLKKSLHDKKNDIRGKVLGCHCYPEMCHGDFLASWAGGSFSGGFVSADDLYDSVHANGYTGGYLNHENR